MSARAVPAVLWKVTLDSAPAAGPIIMGSRVIVALSSGRIAAHALENGERAWQHEALAEWPTVSDGTHVVVATAAGLLALDNSGHRAWDVTLDKITAPPLAQDGWVLVASETELAALRAADGSVVWRTPSQGQRERPSIEGQTVYVPHEDGRVRALDLATGTERWARRLGGAATEILPFPDRVFVGSDDKYFYALDADDGEIAWRTRVGAPLRGKPASDGVQVFVLALDHALRAYDRGSGSLRWSPRGVPFRPAAGPVFAGGKVFVAGAATDVRAFDATTGKPAGDMKLPQPLAGRPTFTTTPAGVLMAAVTGNLEGTWELALWGSAPEPIKASPPSSPALPR